MASLNVMHLRDSSGLYGAERVLLALAKYLDPKRFKLSLLCLQDKEGHSTPLANSAKVLGIPVELIPVRNAWDWIAVKAIRRSLIRHGVTIIHTHDFKSTLFGFLASSGLGIKRVVTLHGSVKDSFKIRLSLWLEEFIIRNSFDMAIAVADDLRVQLLEKGFRTERVQLIQNGIDLSLFAKKEMRAGSTDGAVFGVVGRLLPDKGHSYFLQAFGRVARQYPTTKAIFVGSGVYKDTLEQEIKRLELQGRVALYGERSDMAELYSGITCLVIPSLREGLPYVLLEALASRVPVIATAVGDIPKLVRHGETGFLVPPGNAAEIERCMRTVLNEPDVAHALAQNGYKVLLERYSSDRMVRETEDLYSMVVSPI